MAKLKNVDSLERIQQTILLIRGEKVILDTDLAALYEVPTKRLNEQVKRNKDRFPEDFMFRLNAEEKSQVVAKCDHLSKLKFSPTRPYAFTEHGAIMAANVLNSKKAIEMSVLIVRAFVKMREMLGSHAQLVRKLAQVEKKLTLHDKEIIQLFAALRELMAPKAPPKKRQIGFKKDDA